MIFLIVPGEPVAQGRARITTIGRHPRVFDPKKSAEYKSYVRHLANKIKGRPLEGPLVMKCDFYKGVPKSWSEKKRQQALAGLIKPIGRPDCSNYLKGVEDALNGIAYIDDSQLVLVHVTKQYSLEPRAEIRIWNDNDELNDKYINGRDDG
jgi:Holliday junction resolvase RusA-like endonuclease